MNKKLIILLMFLYFSITNVHAYVYSYTSSNTTVRWPANVTLIDLYVNSQNTQGLTNTFIQNNVTNSISEWNGKSRLALRKNTTSAINQDNLNEIFFSTDPEIFNGSGVVGITQVLFKNTTGEILEADIILNDDFSFGTNSNDLSYLGNVITHELGHFLGMGHSQVLGATMFYSLTRGQHRLDSDDIAGVFSAYPISDTSKGALYGKVIGGSSVGVFGAHVQAVSLKTGLVGGASISEVDGSFTINGLNRSDEYYLFIEPIVKIGLPSKYSNVKSDFCNSSQNYRGSFFQSCGASSEGFPQAVKLSGSSVNVGNITIRCNLDVPSDYLQNKGETPSTFDIALSSAQGLGNSFVGYFSAQELTSLLTKDYFRLNYSNIDWDDVSPTGDLYLDLKILNQPFYSAFKANVTVIRNSSTVTITPKYSQNADGFLILDTSTKIAINRNDPNDNNFEVEIAPENMKFPFYPTGIPFDKSDFFPSNADFEDPLRFYLVSAAIVRDEGGGVYSFVGAKKNQLTDNTQCSDAANTYSLTDYTVNRTVASSSKKAEDDGILACGSVVLNGHGGSGPGGFFVGLILTAFLMRFMQLIVNLRRSKYSKLALAEL